jgi:hypothetical protein
MRMRTHVPRLLASLFFGIMIISTAGAKAEDVTPSQVFQVTEDIIAQLNRLHKANFTKADFTNTRLEIPERLPRHAFVQALNVESKIQVLKRVNGIKTNEISPLPVKEIVPADVLQISKALLAELMEFDKPFGLPPFKQQAKMVEGKTPTDVYANLLRAETMITQLGIPESVPNEVFNIAVAITKEIELLRIQKEKTTPIQAPSASIGKSPADTYTVAFYALKGLADLTKKKEYTIPKGVIMPDKIRKDITPRDVQQILLYCLAELSSMKVAAGIKDMLVLPTPTSGQTPSTVFDQLGIVNTQIQSLVW